MVAASAEDDYPLNCIDDTGDGFSGWYAVSNPRRCNDFCFWDIPDGRATWRNTADPHRTTAVVNLNGTSHWTCAYDAADDKTTVSQAEGERWIESWERYSGSRLGHDTLSLSGASFPYLRCQKGAGEWLKTRSGEAVRSGAFWEGWIVLVSLVFAGEIAALIFYYGRGRRPRYALVGGESFGDDDIGEGPRSSLQIEEENQSDAGVVRDVHGEESLRNGKTGGSAFLMRFSLNRDGEHRNSDRVGPRCEHCAPLAATCRGSKTVRWLFSVDVLRVLLVAALNLLLVFTVCFSAISLMEIRSNPLFTEGMQRLTPACADPSRVCAAGNEDIDRRSKPWPPRDGPDGRPDGGPISEGMSAGAMEPFSYLIASDAQLYWFNGEFAEMGTRPLPPSCSPSDSCGRCTGKHGLSTNQRMKVAWENMMTGKATGLNSSDAPIPNTLVMNGDVTAYFHPHEKRAYDSIFGGMDGLKHYFPSLGNHDMEHLGGGMYGGDEWIGQPNCNMQHAVGWFKSGFCGGIPGFDAGRIARYDPSSLAYSWDEGRYHFVHSHYYPTYEMASAEYRSSLEWLDRDLRLARDAGLTTILFVHAAQGLNRATEGIILGKNVRAIIAGHTHRCLHRRCEGVHPLREDQVERLNATELAAEKCIPAAYDTCQVLEGGMHMIYAKDLEAGAVSNPTRMICNRERKDRPLCPKPSPLYINETDNSLLCRRVLYSEPDYPFGDDHNSTETIPIFWSGSSSFETFLRGDFHGDRFVINAMAPAPDGGGAMRYTDLRAVPNAVYPHHHASDVEETTIYL